jgi:hypothetical protein
MDHSHETYGVVVTSALLAPIMSHFLSRLARAFRVPPVIAMLFVGMLMRQVHGEAVAIKFQTLTGAALDVSLASMGLQIGSHLNEEAIGPYRGHVIKFMVVLVPAVFGGMFVLVRVLFGESMAPYAPIVASISLERSSAECMLGICESRAEGPFSSVTMCTSALLDVISLLFFVITSASLVVGSAFVEALGHVVMTLSSTGCASGVVYLIALLIREPLIVLAVATSTLALASKFLHSELILSAVVAGIVLNYKKQHPITVMIEDLNHMLCCVLFTFMGHRMNVANFTTVWSLQMACLLVAARFFCLFTGGYAGGVFAGFREHNGLRWMGLVTQLAISLSLVNRLESSFPESAPLARSYGAAVIMFMCTGPGLLVMALHRSGEAGLRKTAPHQGS